MLRLTTIAAVFVGAALLVFAIIAGQPAHAASPVNLCDPAAPNASGKCAAVSGGALTVQTNGPQTTVPNGNTSTETGGTLGAAGTFSSVAAANSNRRGCLLQNTSGDTEFVFFGATGSATTANSFQLGSLQSLNCASGGIVATDNIAVAGKNNASDTYVISVQ
jgi:hypothetical protein